MPSLIPESGKQKVKYDIGGFVTFFIAMATLLYFLSNAGEAGGISGAAGITLLVVSILSWIAFFYTGRKVADPMVNLDFFKNAQFTIGIVSMFMTEESPSIKVWDCWKLNRDNENCNRYPTI